MNLKPWKACLLALGLALSAAALPAAQTFDSPTGLTLLAQGDGRYLLLWDPIYRDDLQGYSVWLRKPGDKEFVRLSIPVKVGKEVKKEPITSDSKVVLSMGRDRDDLEMTVVAEYEDGVSLKAPVARSAWAKRPAPAAAPVATPEPDGGGPADASGTAATGAPGEAAAGAAQRQPYPLDADKAPADQPSLMQPWAQHLALSQEPLILEPGKIATSLGMGFDYDRFITKGTDLESNLIFGSSDPTKLVSWQRTDVRTVFSMPLTLRLGLWPGVELWAQAAYHAEDYYFESYVVDGTTYQNIYYYNYGPGGQVVLMSNPTSAGLGDSLVGLRVQPMDAQPLLLGAQFSLPTGISRFKSMLDYFNNAGTPAGTGEGVLRLMATADWGYKGKRPGLSFHGAFEPGATESYNTPFLGSPTLPQTAELGSMWELGGAFTFPWAVMGYDGSLALGAQERSIQADRWTVMGFDADQFFSRGDLGEIAALSGLEFQRDDQLELSLCFYQDLVRGFRTEGKLAYTIQSMGDAFTVAGQINY